MKYGAIIDSIGTKNILHNAYEIIIPNMTLFSLFKYTNVFFMSLNEFLIKPISSNLLLLSYFSSLHTTSGMSKNISITAETKKLIAFIITIAFIPNNPYSIPAIIGPAKFTMDPT